MASFFDTPKDLKIERTLIGLVALINTANVKATTSGKPRKKYELNPIIINDKRVPKKAKANTGFLC